MPGTCAVIANNSSRAIRVDAVTGQGDWGSDEFTPSVGAMIEPGGQATWFAGAPTADGQPGGDPGGRLVLDVCGGPRVVSVGHGSPHAAAFGGDSTAVRHAFDGC